MADTFTTYFNLNKPEVGGSRDAWGEKLNGNMDIIDATLNTLTTGKVDRAGDKITGALSIEFPEPEGAFWGRVRLNSGGAARGGLIEFIHGNAAHDRTGYIGLSDDTYNYFVAEKGRHWKFTGSPTGYVYNDNSVWVNNGNINGTAWNGWLSDYLNSNKFVYGNAWHATAKTLIGYSGAWPYLYAQIDSSNLGYVMTSNNLTNFVGTRITGHQSQVYNYGVQANLGTPYVQCGMTVTSTQFRWHYAYIQYHNGQGWVNAQ